MKAVFIAYNEAMEDHVLEALHKSFIKGYTAWEHIKGVGSNDGEPHLGSHAWPTMNSGIITFVEDDLVKGLKERLKKADEENSRLGLRFFSWSVDD
ncbi:MAG: PG0541 family transporter-associated protein [Candidatus Egerieousia sp.]